MDLFIDNKSGAPIYDQIYTQIKDQIIQGALQPDEAMPSIRGLARDLRISVIPPSAPTTNWKKRAFSTQYRPRAFLWPRRTPSCCGKRT